MFVMTCAIMFCSLYPIMPLRSFNWNPIDFQLSNSDTIATVKPELQFIQPWRLETVAGRKSNSRLWRIQDHILCACCVCVLYLTSALHEHICLGCDSRGRGPQQGVLTSAWPHPQSPSCHKRKHRLRRRAAFDLQTDQWRGVWRPTVFDMQTEKNSDSNLNIYRFSRKNNTS